MKIEDLVAELAEANRKKRIEAITGSQSVFLTFNLDFSAPIYFFRNLYDPSSKLYNFWNIKAQMPKWHAEGLNLLKNDHFFVPNSQCILLYETVEHIDNVRSCNVFHVIHYKQVVNDTILHSFSYFDYTGGQRWISWPVRIHMNQLTISNSHSQNLLHYYVNLSTMSSIAIKSLQQQITNIMCFSLVSTIILSKPADIKQTYLPLSRKTIDINSGRTKAGKLPINNVIEIELFKIRYAQNPATVGTGSPKRPHNRRGTYTEQVIKRRKGTRIYTLRIHRKECTIHGGTLITPLHAVKEKT
jgi:hypothetical protein